MGAKTFSLPLLLAIGLALGVCALGLYLSWPSTRIPPLYRGCAKVWSHRTLGSGAPENSLDGLRRAFASGLTGVEIDVIYAPQQQSFFVISEEAVAAGRSPALGLAEVLAEVPSDGLVWLDFWNLKQLPEQDFQHAVGLLRTELETAGMTDRAIVESADASRLGAVAALGIRTSLWIEIRPMSSGRFAHLGDLVRAAWEFHTADFAAVSLNYEQYGDLVRLVFARVPVLLFTVNDPGTLRRLAQEPHVMAIVSDSPDIWTPDCSRERVEFEWRAASVPHGRFSRAVR